jgi:transglutaminase-like putative cysteine protease
MGTSNQPPQPPLENKSVSPHPQKGKRVLVTIAVLLALLVAVAGVVLYMAKHGPSVKGAGNAGAGDQTNMTAFIANLTPDEKQQAYKDEVQTLQDRLTRLQAYLDGFPKALTDVDSLAPTLTTPEAAFEFVRDRVALEPYPGVMKGARPTLLTRGGNSLDRALLLAAILKQNGVPVKIAHGKLPPDQAQKLLQQIAAQPGSLEQILQSLAGQSPPTTLTDHQQEFGKRLDQRKQQAGSAVNDALEKNLPILLSALKKAGVPDAAATASRQLEILQDHYWVTATVADQPVDLDPSGKDASVNAKLTDAVETFDPDDLADTLFQHVRFRLVGEFLENGHLQSSELLSKEVKATDLFGKNVRLAVAPFTPKTNETRFQPLLLVGDDRTDGQAFRLSGQSSGGEEKSDEGTSGADTGAAKAAGGLLGGLGGDEEAAPAPKPEPKVKPAATAGGPVLARLFLEATSAGPHLSDAHYQRVILDRLEASGSKLQIQPALADDKVVRALLVQAWDGAISVGSNNLVYVLGAQLENLKAQESMGEKARSRAFLGESFGVDDLSGPTLPPELIDYFFSSDVARFLLSRRHAPKAKSYYERPRLAFFRHGFVVGDWSKPQGAHRFAEGIDLLNAPFQFVGDGNDAQRLAVEAGIADTALERMTVQPDRSFNTVPLFSAASAEGVSILTITPAQKPALDDLTIPTAIKNVLAGELAQGQTLILPARLVKLTDTQTYGWWSVDPATGMALGKMELGGAQAMTETSEINERIEKWTEIFAKFYGGVLKCYMQALGDNLGGIEVLKTGHMAHGAPGESPMPDADKLASCVIKQACDAVAEILTEAAFSPGFAKEAEAEIRPLEEIIMNWAMEKMNEKATGDIKDGMAKACEERAGAGEE